MSFSWSPPKHVDANSTDSAELARYLARQPIMDLRGCVHGYELLYRNGPDSSFSGDSELATRTMIDNLVLFGVENLANGHPAFFNCTAESISKLLIDILHADRSVLEIPASVTPTKELLETCHQLKNVGFRLAIDNFVWNPEIGPLLEIADYVKVDFNSTGNEERQVLSEKIGGLPIAKIALRVETQAVFRQACKEGFTLFQGYYFCCPALVKNRKIPDNRLSQLAILELINKEALDMRALGDKLKLDAALTYRLLRLVNSPIYSTREKICSIDAALLVIGEEAFRHFATLAIASELGSDQPLELLRMAFTRGAFCESSAHLLALDSTEQYLLGLLSLIPAMLRMPVAALTPLLPLRTPIKDALKGARNAECALLHWLIGLENGDWEACDHIADRFSLDSSVLVKNYSQAVLSAEKALGAAS